MARRFPLVRPPPASPSLLPIAVVGLAAVAALWFAGRRAAEPAPPPEIPRVVVAPAPAPDFDAGAASELARLRAEVKGLREQLDTAHTSLEQTSAALEDTARELERLRRPLDLDMASSTLRANLAPGEGVVTGGYRLPDGTRLFAFVETDALPDGGVGVTSRFFAVPDELARSVGLGTLATEAANTLQHGEVWVRDELTEVAAKLATAPDSRVLSAGGVALQPGRPADVPLRMAENSPPLSLNVSAAYDAQRNLDLELRVESTPAPAAPVEPVAPEAPADAPR